jgi:hypothetical protein
MKAHINIIKAGLVACAVMALALTTSAADNMKGAEHLLHLQGIKTKAEVEALKPGDTLAMVCTKCKTVFVERVTIEKGHIKTVTPGTTHACTGCNSTIEVVGHGKSATDVVKHSCKACGDDSVFCCASKPGSGTTKGMEKK